MASPLDATSTAFEDVQDTVSLDEPSKHADTDEAGMKDDKSQDGKKSKRSGKSGKRKAAAKKLATGFEEFYCDPPITPAEYNVEKDVIYPPHRPFVARIEECIQRFRARRRLGPERDVIFSRYLLLGGIDSTVRQFQGSRNIENDILEEATKSAVREMTADDVVQRGGGDNHNSRFYNPNYPEHWEVDFAGVAAGFLSEHLPMMVCSSMPDFRMGVDVVLNFLKYVDCHDVCPEYADDIKKAQNICLQALEEIPAIKELQELIPGYFNTALRVLYVKDEDGSLPGPGARLEEMLPDIKEARISYAVTLSILMEPKRYSTDTEWAVTRTIELAYEVLAITLPGNAARAKYKTVNQYLSNHPNIQPCGCIKARPVVIRDGWDNTMTATIPPEDDVEAEFVLEEDILRLLKVGMKLTMGVCMLNVGLKFIKYVKEIRPSFYVFLPQELMFHYKEPVLNNRLARSIHDVDGEEDGLAGVCTGDQDN